MKPRLVLASIVSTLVLIGSVQYAFGAAVMSVDLGSEWMKVSTNPILILFLLIVKWAKILMEMS